MVAPANIGSVLRSSCFPPYAPLLLRTARRPGPLPGRGCRRSSCDRESAFVAGIPINRLLASFVISFRTGTRHLRGAQVDARPLGPRHRASRACSCRLRCSSCSRGALRPLPPETGRVSRSRRLDPRVLRDHYPSPGRRRNVSVGPSRRGRVRRQRDLRAAVDRQDLGAGGDVRVRLPHLRGGPVVLVIVTIALPLVVAPPAFSPQTQHHQRSCCSRIERAVAEPLGALFVRKLHAVSSPFAQPIAASLRGARPRFLKPGPCPGDSTRP